MDTENHRPQCVRECKDFAQLSAHIERSNNEPWPAWAIKKYGNASRFDHTPGMLLSYARKVAEHHLNTLVCDLLETIDLHTDCMSNELMINRALLDEAINKVETMINSVDPEAIKPGELPSSAAQSVATDKEVPRCIVDCATFAQMRAYLEHVAKEPVPEWANKKFGHVTFDHADIAISELARRQWSYPRMLMRTLLDAIKQHTNETGDEVIIRRELLDDAIDDFEGYLRECTDEFASAS